MRGSENSSIGRSGSNKSPITLGCASLNSSVEELQALIEQLSAQLRGLVEHRAVSATEPVAAAATSTESKAERSSRISCTVEELLATKKSDGLSRRYLETIRSHLHRFAERFKCDIGDVTTRQIEEWLRSFKIGPRARNNIRASIVLLFHFARKHGCLPKGQPTEADEVAKAKDRGGKIGILAPDELARVLAHSPEKVRLFLVLGAFTGMRSSEILRLEWGDINFDRALITVAAEKAKTATRRLVPIGSNLMQWLEPYRGQSGPLFKTRRDADRAISFAKACGIRWPTNALRHSYASYRLAVTANAARVALEMGNSPQKLMSNYRELVDEGQANAWFAILPGSPPDSSQCVPS